MREAHDSLTPESRINYVKPSTLEHNFKVQLVGDVIAEDLGILAANWHFYHVPNPHEFTTTQ